MSREEALYQSLSAAGAALITFIGICHETVGQIIFPWGAAVFGGQIGWHAAGVLCIAAGLTLLAAALDLIRFPVVAASALVALAGLAAFVFTLVMHGAFHVFALTLAIASVTIIVCHRRATRLAVNKT